MLKKHLLNILLLTFLFFVSSQQKKKSLFGSFKKSFKNFEFDILKSLEKKGKETTPVDKKANKEKDLHSSNVVHSFVPTKILHKLRKVKTLDDFIKNFKPEGVHENHKKQTSEISFTLHKSHKEDDHDGPEHDYENEVELKEPTDFGCKPRPKIIPVPADYTSIFWPSCVELDQCGGCCFNSAQFECVPSTLSNRSTTVFRIPLDGTSPSPHNVYMVHHSKCKCQCRIRPRDCLPTQSYDEQNCQCFCKKDEEKCPYGKQWSHRECRCVCKYTYPCQKREIWDDNNCKCKCKRSKCRAPHQLDPVTCRCVYLASSF